MKSVHSFWHRPILLFDTALFWYIRAAKIQRYRFVNTYTAIANITPYNWTVLNENKCNYHANETLLSIHTPESQTAFNYHNTVHVLFPGLLYTTHRVCIIRKCVNFLPVWISVLIYAPLVPYGVRDWEESKRIVIGFQISFL